MASKKQKLGLVMLTALVTGNMVGSGVFMLPAELARVGTIGLLSWVFTALGALCLALVFAKMSILIPKTGGPYAYALSGFGEFVGFQTACYYWIALWIGNTGILVAMLGYLTVFFPALNHPLPETIAAIIIIWFVAAINILGVRGAGILQLITTFLKFVPLLFIGIVGWYYFHPAYITESFNVTPKSNFSAFSYAATLTFWAFVGVESATIPAGSVSNPKRNIPLATILGTAVAAVIYIISAVAIAGMLPAKILGQSTSPFAEATAIIFGDWGRMIIAVGAIISCFGSLNGWTLVTGQVPMAAANDKLFPKIFAKCNRFHVPANGIIISSLLMTGLVIVIQNLNLLDQFQVLILVTSAASLIAYFYTAFAEIIILPKRENLTHKNFAHLIIAVLTGVYSLWALVGSGETIVFYLTGLMLLIVPFYAWLHFRRRGIKLNAKGTVA